MLQKPDNKIEEIQILIGKNILLLQEIEQLLKFIIYHESGKGLEKDLKKRKKNIDAMPLGKLLNKKMTDRHNSTIDPEITPLNETYVSYSFTLGKTDISILKKSVETDVLEERNILVHKFLIENDLTNDIGIAKAKKFLTEQHEKITKQKLPLVESRDALIKVGSTLNNFLNSQAYADFLKQHTE